MGAFGIYKHNTINLYAIPAYPKLEYGLQLSPTLRIFKADKRLVPLNINTQNSTT